MESLVHAAVAELKKVEDRLEVRTGPGGGEEADGREKMVRTPGLAAVQHVSCWNFYGSS